MTEERISEARERVQRLEAGESVHEVYAFTDTWAARPPYQLLIDQDKAAVYDEEQSRKT